MCILRAFHKSDTWLYWSLIRLVSKNWSVAYTVYVQYTLAMQREAPHSMQHVRLCPGNIAIEHQPSSADAFMYR